jgi:dihydropteroate synthase
MTMPPAVSNESHPVWRTNRFELALCRPLVMGIVNVTPDSFFDGGQFDRHADAFAHCDRLLAQGADILDIGGESTRPGAMAPDAEEELRRVLPVLRHAVTLGCPVSLDSSEPVVMRAALDLGVDILNDVRAFQRPGAQALVAAHRRVAICMMHMQGEPAAMQASPGYANVVTEVAKFLSSRRQQMIQLEVASERIVLDPGFGFGKTHDHNLELAQALAEIRALG